MFLGEWARVPRLNLATKDLPFSGVTTYGVSLSIIIILSLVATFSTLYQPRLLTIMIFLDSRWELYWHFFLPLPFFPNKISSDWSKCCCYKKESTFLSFPLPNINLLFLKYYILIFSFFTQIHVLVCLCRILYSSLWVPHLITSINPYSDSICYTQSHFFRIRGFKRDRNYKSIPSLFIF